MSDPAADPGADVPRSDPSASTPLDTGKDRPDPRALDRRAFVRRAARGSAALWGAAALGLPRPVAGSRHPGAPATAGGLLEPDPRRQATRPNVVLIVADDMGYSDIGCYGGEMRTPALDGLAADGLRFTHFHNGARCCPSRASLLTGLWAQQAGVGDMMNDGGVDGYRGDLAPDAVSLAEVLRGAGYGTYACGKWHVTRFLEPDEPRHNWPLQRGFDRYYGTLNGADSYFEPCTLMRDNDPVPDEELGEDFYYTDALADHAVRFVGDHLGGQPDRPFFLYQTYTAPHWPLHAPAEYVETTKGRFDAGWDALRRARYERMVAMGIVDPRWALTERDRRVPPWEEAAGAEDADWQLRRMEVYAAQIEAMDRGIGRLVELLRSRGALENTLFLFLSDNGGCAEEFDETGWNGYILHGGEHVAREFTRDGRRVQIGDADPSVMPGPDDTYQTYGIPWANVSNTPFRLYKSFTHEGGVATPFIVHWPAGIAARGELRRQPAHLVDVMATLVDVAGAEYPAERRGVAVTPMEGVSLEPAFEDRALDRELLYFEHEGNRAVLGARWKAVARGRNGAWELYDMQVDRTETRNLAERHPDELRRLTGLWEAWAERVGVYPKPGQR